MDELYDHSVAVHLPKPSPVSLPIASAAKSFSVSIDASSARGNNAGSGGCPDVGRREETLTDSAQGGRWRTWFSNAKQGDRSRSARRHDLPRGPEKEHRRLLQKHHTADGHHHQAVSDAQDCETERVAGTVAARRQEQLGMSSSEEHRIFSLAMGTFASSDPTRRWTCSVRPARARKTTRTSSTRHADRSRGMSASRSAH